MDMAKGVDGMRSAVVRGSVSLHTYTVGIGLRWGGVVRTCDAGCALGMSVWVLWFFGFWICVLGGWDVCTTISLLCCIYIFLVDTKHM